MNTVNTVRIGLFLLCFIWLCAIEKSLYPLILLLGIAIHEAGHILAAAIVKAPANGICTQYFGITLYYDFSDLSYTKELFVLICGAAANFISAALALYLFGNASTAVFFAVSSFAFGVFNLIPFRKSDGGKAISTLCALVFSPNTQEKVTYIMHFVSILFFWGMAVTAQFIYNINLSLLVLSVYLLLEFILI